MKTRQLVATSAVVSVATLVLAELGKSNELPSTRQFIGFGAAFTFLSVLSDFDLEFAGGLAVLAMVAIILSRGEDALNFIQYRGGFERPKRDTMQAPSRPLRAKPRQS